MKNHVLMIISCSILLPSAVLSQGGMKTFKAVQAKDSDFCEYPDEQEPGQPGGILFMPGCSWYCGGSVDGFSASSELQGRDSLDYMAENIHDFDLETAWVEGREDYGIGEYVVYTLDTREKGDHALGVTTIILANGYKKTRRLWELNSRVKKIRMFVDEKSYAVLELLDSFEIQTISIGEIMLPKKGIMRFKFEIADVYPGKKYKDTAITELVFDGVGVH